MEYTRRGDQSREGRGNIPARRRRRTWPCTRPRPRCPPSPARSPRSGAPAANRPVRIRENQSQEGR
eukprot:11117-Prorocentrum_minimum.AAC.1